MKQGVLITFFIVYAAYSFGQLEVRDNPSKVIYENAGRQALTQVIIESDTLYLLTFQDRKYTQIVEIKSIEFSNKAELVQFLGLCTDVLGGRESVITEKYTISQAGKKWVDISNGVGWTYLKVKTIEDMKAAIR